VDRYSYVMHLVSRVVGELRHDLDALHAYRACMNMGTLSGAPKNIASRSSFGTFNRFCNKRKASKTEREHKRASSSSSGLTGG
ncbi:chorismate-binding protein, partial [Escherichia coli]|uniref:chorismate-binding protein n=1 Tax=Escherichia coli TaxID=562 RepID=UPI0021D25845